MFTMFGITTLILFTIILGIREIFPKFRQKNRKIAQKLHNARRITT